MAGASRRKRSERLQVPSPDDQRATDPLGGKLPGGDELTDPVRRDPEHLGCFARADEITRLGHRPEARWQPY
jgi:hypothetical protein